MAKSLTENMSDISAVANVFGKEFKTSHTVIQAIPL